MWNDSMNNFFGGYRIFVDDMMCVKNKYTQFRFPRSKKKRIRKKFSKDLNNSKVSKEHSIFFTGNVWIMSTEGLKQLREKIKRESMI